MPSKYAVRKAEALAIKIWGKWAYDHEYGDRKDRERAKGQHNSKLDATSKLLERSIDATIKERQEKVLKKIESHLPFGTRARTCDCSADMVYIINKIRESKIK